MSSRYTATYRGVKKEHSYETDDLALAKSWLILKLATNAAPEYMSLWDNFGNKEVFVEVSPSQEREDD